MLKGAPLWLAALLFGFGAPLCGGALGEGGGRTLFFETEDIPAQVVTSTSFVVQGKNSRHTEWHVLARGRYAGQPLDARGDLLRDPGVGADIQIRVPKKRPDLAIPFVGDAPRGRFVWLVGFAFAAAGAALLVGGLRSNRRHLRLLLNGQLTRGKLVERVDVPVKNGVNHRLTFAFDAQRGGRVRTTITVGNLDLKRLIDEQEEWLVYDPHAPTRCVLLDALPDHVRVDADGNLTPIPAQRAVYRSLPLVAIVMAVIAGLVLSRLFE